MFREKSCQKLKTEGLIPSHMAAPSYNSFRYLKLAHPHCIWPKALTRHHFLPRKAAGLSERLGDDPALGLAGIFRTWIAADGGAPH